MDWSYIPTLLLVVALSLPGHIMAAEEETEINEDGSYKIQDVLATKWGQCPIPAICLRGSNRCGTEDGSGHVTIDCSYREAGPYIPVFPEYVISRRTWTFDFSNNGFMTLDAYSFLTSNLVPVNLTSLDLSHNYLSSIREKTFSGAVSKDLVRLILSQNRLTTFEAGTFDDLPAIKLLDLSHNRIVSVDPVCSARFPMLTSLNLKYNKISHVTLDCLSAAQKRVSLALDNNYIGSIDDCSYSSQVTPSLENNPILCGCSDKRTGTRCLLMSEDSQTSSPSTQSSCRASACVNVTFDLSYQPVNTALNKKYKIEVKFADGSTHQVQLFEYVGLGNESVSATLLQSTSDTAAVSQFSSDSPLTTSNNYTLCVIPQSDKEARHRSCQYLSPPYFYRSSGAESLHLSTSVLWTLSLYGVHSVIMY